MNDDGSITHAATLAATGAFGLVVAAGGAIDSFNGTLIALGLLTTALTGAYTSWKTHQVHKEFKVFNSMTPGEQIDAATLARLEAIPRPKRTAAEQSHLDDAPPKDPPQGPTS